ncbi:alpha,alpha-trehalase [candidate division KSB1 bacterium]|nr:alpha,alpha-trehalase [candidate division KSB1 bacterium]
MPPVESFAGDPFNVQKGIYFHKKVADSTALPQWERTKSLLPSPIYDADPIWVETYWKAWELAFRNFHSPHPQSGFVSRFIDAAFNQNIFLWDTCFMTFFCALGHPLVPGIESLDNFYCKQYPNGEICREIDRTTGLDFAPWVNEERQNLFSRWGFNQEFIPQSAAYFNRALPQDPPFLTLDALNHPLLAWAELESFAITGDSLRLALVFEPLWRYYQALKTYLRQGNGLYLTDWASMDNSPRNRYLKGCQGAVDISSEMVLFARNLIEIARVADRNEVIPSLQQDIELTRDRINRLMWDAEQEFYFDLDSDGTKSPIKTIAAFWTLVAGVASPGQSAALVKHLSNPATFGRPHRVPTISADQNEYNPRGGYWSGAVWAPTNTMVIRGLQHTGHDSLAREIALEHLAVVADVYSRTGTIWENYQAEACEPGWIDDSTRVKPDFVGWSGIGPVLYLLEFAVGLLPNAPENRVTWNINTLHRSGCLSYRFNGQVIDFIAHASRENESQRQLTVECNAPFHLHVHSRWGQHRFSLSAGAHILVIKEQE